MKYIVLLLTISLFVLNISKSFAEDSLTTKQQLDRIMEELKDLNKAVFNKSFDKNNNYDINNTNDTERFTSIDIRIYDLEKDIKSLTLQFEEILFKLDDLSNDVSSLETELVIELEKKILDSKTDSNDAIKSKKKDDKSIKQENTLGSIVISDKTNSSIDKNVSQLEGETEINDQDKELSKLTPEEQMQFALDQMMKKNYDKSKKILEDFIIHHNENQLSGSAHFWLGKIYLFEANYRKAAIVFGEGVQRFPKSIKAAEMYYELAKSLKEMNKIQESCKTLALLEEGYKGNKFTKDPEKIKEKLNCQVSN